MAKQTSQKTDGEVVIALLGVTGAGKSTFVSIASGERLEIGHGVDPCTQNPQAVRFVLDGRPVILIDTPGFDDDQRSDVQILEAIYKWLNKKGYLRHHRLDGLIFLHPVTLNRVGGAEQKRTRLLREILGPKAYKRIIIATTMWEDLKSEDIATRRLEGRQAENGIWHEMLKKGAVMVRHNNNKESAHEIIRKVVATSDKNGKIRTLLEEELSINEGHVGKTSAGKVVKDGIRENLRLLREQHKALLEDLERDQHPPSRKEKREKKAELRELNKKIQAKESDLRKVDTMIWRIKNFLSEIFSGPSS